MIITGWSCKFDPGQEPPWPFPCQSAQGCGGPFCWRALGLYGEPETPYQRPPQTPYSELADKRWFDVWRRWRRGIHKLFFEWPFTAMVSYDGEPLYFEMETYETTPVHHNDNQRG